MKCNSVKSMADVIAEMSDVGVEIDGEISGIISEAGNDFEKIKENNAFDDSNYRSIFKLIQLFCSNFLYDDVKKVWNKKNRVLDFKTKQFDISIPIVDNAGYVSHLMRVDKKFAPLTDQTELKKALALRGFYSRYFNFDLDWRATGFHKDLLNDFFLQFVINGENEKGIYIYGDIGVGKSTTITNIAKILLMFLDVEIYYITMAGLVSLITSIDAIDKIKINTLKNCSILFIDNLGFEEYTTNNQMSQVIDFFVCRYGNEKTNIIAGNEDIREDIPSNAFVKQMSDYLNDTNYYKCYEMRGDSKRK